MQQSNTLQRVTRTIVAGAAAILVVGAALAYTSAPADASPSMVTAKKPCGSCHPPGKPPRR